jgi:hypothetical protein
VYQMTGTDNWCCSYSCYLCLFHIPHPSLQQERISCTSVVLTSSMTNVMCCYLLRLSHRRGRPCGGANFTRCYYPAPSTLPQSNSVSSMRNTAINMPASPLPLCWLAGSANNHSSYSHTRAFYLGPLVCLSDFHCFGPPRRLRKATEPSDPSSPVVTICNTRFSVQKLYILPTQLYLCVLFGSQNKQRLFPYTALTDWFL